VTSCKCCRIGLPPPSRNKLRAALTSSPFLLMEFYRSQASSTAKRAGDGRESPGNTCDYSRFVRNRSHSGWPPNRSTTVSMRTRILPGTGEPGGRTKGIIEAVVPC
jgi:hypothetical protein